MGCFSIPKNKSKVASHQADQNYGSKLEHMLPSNKPVVLPDPDYIAGGQSPGPGPLPAPASVRGSVKSRKDRGSSVANLSTAKSYSASSRLSNHHSRALSAPLNFPSPGAGDDVLAGPFSAPLPSHPDLDGSPLSSPPSANYGAPLCCAGVGVWEVKRSASLDKKMMKTASFQERRAAFGGRPFRLPSPESAASNGHPLPHPPGPDDVAAGVGVKPSPNRGKDGTRSLNSFRTSAIGARASPVEAMPLPPPALPTQSRTPVRAFRYSELAHCFVPECFLGDGIFGSAYRTWVDQDDHGENKQKIEVAVVCPVVKALQGLKEWMAEVNWLARLQDPHLCRLIGYCAEDVPGLGSKRLLVYEYMCNGSLDQYYKDKQRSRSMDWSTRIRVALDVAQGLAYLHDKAPFQVICRDLSSPNIQLERDFRAKLSGFGLARCGPEGEQGPPMAGPYAAPESSANGLVTIKSNAWSFGVVLLELLTGRRHMDPSLPAGQQNLVQSTKPFLRDESKLFLIMDPDLNGRYSCRGALKGANLAFQCLIKEASLRPNLSEAVELLRTIQTDEETMTSDLKKSRSFPQSIGSPMNYSRSASDPFVPRDHKLTMNFLGNSVTSSPSSEPKQRECESLKIASLGSATSSPSFVESRLANDSKQSRSSFTDREGQKLGASLQPAEPKQPFNINHHRERELQKLVNVHSVDTTRPAHFNETKQHVPVKVADPFSSISLVPSLADSTQSSSLVQLQGPEVRKLQVPGNRHQSREAPKNINRAQPLEAFQASDLKPQTTGSIPQNEMRPRSSEAWKLPSSYMLQNCGIKLQQHPDTGKGTGSRVNSGEIDLKQHPVARKLPCPMDFIQQEVSDTGGRQDRDAAELPTISPAVEFSMQLNEMKNQEQDIQKSSSARSSASSLVSCAPALIFEPPMLREAF